MAYVKIKQHTGDTGNLIEYILDWRKTKDGEYVYGYNCEPDFADLEFLITDYNRCFSRGNGVGVSEGNRNIAAYHIIQSFDVQDDISPEEALEIGKKFASEMFGTDYEYVVATHVDTNHIHNHIAVNAVSFMTLKKFHCQPYKTIAKMRNISDHLCEQYGFSIIDNPTFKRNKEKIFYAQRDGRSVKGRLEDIIDEAILHSSSFEEFKLRLSEENVLIKEGKNSDYISFKFPEDKRFTGGASLGEAYTKKNIIARIDTGAIEPDPELKISFHKKLLEKETELSYISRIPYTKSFVEFKKSEVAQKGQVFFVKLKPHKIYRVKDEEGNEIGTLKGSEFFNHYQDIANYRSRLEEKEIQKVLENPEQEAVNNYAVNFLRKTKKQTRAEVQELSKALLYIRKEGITSFDDFEEKLNAHEIKLLKYNTELQKYSKQLPLYNKALGYLKIKKALQPIVSEYTSLGGRKQEAFGITHKKEIEEYALANEKLMKMGVSGNIDIEKIEKSLEKANEIISDLQTQIKAENRRLQAVSEARNITHKYSDKIAGNRENESQAKVNNREDVR